MFASWKRGAERCAACMKSIQNVPSNFVAFAVSTVPESFFYAYIMTQGGSHARECNVS